MRAYEKVKSCDTCPLGNELNCPLSMADICKNGITEVSVLRGKEKMTCESIYICPHQKIIAPAQQYSPELLEALKNICNRVHDTWSDCPNSVRNYATEGLKIIAKAEGRE